MRSVELQWSLTPVFMFICMYLQSWVWLASPFCNSLWAQLAQQRLLMYHQPCLTLRGTPVYRPPWVMSSSRRGLLLNSSVHILLTHADYIGSEEGSILQSLWLSPCTYIQCPFQNFWATLALGLHSAILPWFVTSVYIYRKPLHSVYSPYSRLRIDERRKFILQSTFLVNSV